MMYHIFYEKYVFELYELSPNQKANLRHITLAILKNGLTVYNVSSVIETIKYLQTLDVRVHFLFKVVDDRLGDIINCLNTSYGNISSLFSPIVMHRFLVSL